MATERIGDGVFSPSFGAARDRFRQAAKALGATPQPFQIEGRGPSGEDLTIDVVAIGAAQPAKVVVVSSGIHGVEGFFGSAIQTSWLEGVARSGEELPAETAVVLLHALNPYGFAWRRRFNENNVDLNRNFLLPGEAYDGAPREYEELNWFINPKTPPPRLSLFLPLAAFVMLRYGKRTVQAAVSQGQHKFEDGLFFGGKRAEAATRLVQAQFASWVGQAPRVLHLDFHSGLGRFGVCRLLSVEPTGSPRGRWLAQRFAPRRVEPIGEGVAPNTARGTMGLWLNRTLGAERLYAFLAPEFGTYCAIRVFEALRDENRVHRRPEHPAYEKIKTRLVEVFCPKSAAWREAVVKEGLDLIRKAAEVCQDESWEAH
ncbi:MAG TPA: DUF2817 domain-containing protein [Terriglobales bacterium]|nr:DUF2817 domain-containing protein [Terriglobales bacterium]